MTILQLGSETEVAPLDSILVSALASRVSEALADERIFRRTNGNSDLLVGEEWMPDINEYLYIVLVDGKLMYCERTDFDEEHYPG